MENSPEANSDKEFLSKLNLMDENGLKEKTAESSEREREGDICPASISHSPSLPPSPPHPPAVRVFPSHFRLISELFHQTNNFRYK